MLAKKLISSIPQAIRVLRSLSTECLEGSLPFQQLRILLYISEGMSQSKMAEVSKVSLPAISKMIEGLVQKKLVTRSSGEDRRVSVLKLTALGRKIASQVTKHVEEELNTGLKKLSSEERAALESGLKVLDKLIIILKEDKA
jgi:DNA-binding MarR family transcriptional regulator